MKKITLMLGLILPVFGFAQVDCASAEEVVPGVLYTVDAYIGELPTDFDCTEYGGPAAAQANANWYSYTATTTGVALITSDENLFAANAGIDTRLIVYTGTCGALTCTNSQDDVDFPNDLYTSSLLLPVVAGTTYYIVWDDRWTADAGFIWTIEELAVDCTTAIPYSHDFDDNLIFQGCWATADLDANGISWIQQALDLDGDGNDETFSTNGGNGAQAKNDWLFSPAFELTANHSYSISYTFNGADGQTNAANETLTSYVVDQPGANFVFSQQVATNSGILQEGAFADLEALATTANGNFIAPTSGTYYVAFNATSPPNSAFLLLFNVSINDNGLSTGEFNAGKVSLFPNPVASELSVVAQNAIDAVEIYNMLGQQVAAQAFTSNDVRMNVSNLSAGAYTVKVTSAGNVQTMKIVKQ